MHMSVPNDRNPYVASSRPKPGPIGRRYLPGMALIAIGFGLSNYYFPRSPSNAQIQTRIAEEKRLKQNQRLMEAYGDKDSLEDVERALAVYKAQ